MKKNGGMRKIVVNENVYGCTESEFRLLRQLNNESEEEMTFFLQKLVPLLPKVDSVDLVLKIRLK